MLWLWPVRLLRKNLGEPQRSFANNDAVLLIGLELLGSSLAMSSGWRAVCINWIKAGLNCC